MLPGNIQNRPGKAGTSTGATDAPRVMTANPIQMIRNWLSKRLADGAAPPGLAVGSAATSSFSGRTHRPLAPRAKWLRLISDPCVVSGAARSGGSSDGANWGG